MSIWADFSRLADLRPLAFQRIAELWSSERSGEDIFVKAEMVAIDQSAEGASKKYLLAAQTAEHDDVQIAIQANPVASEDLKSLVEAALAPLGERRSPKEVRLGPNLAEFWDALTS